MPIREIQLLGNILRTSIILILLNLAIPLLYTILQSNQIDCSFLNIPYTFPPWHLSFITLPTLSLTDPSDSSYVPSDPFLS